MLLAKWNAFETSQWIAETLKRTLNKLHFLQFLVNRVFIS